MSVTKEKKVTDKQNNGCYIKHGKTKDDFKTRKIVNLIKTPSLKQDLNS